MAVQAQDMTGHRTIALNRQRRRHRAMIRLAVMLTDHGVHAVVKIGARDAVLAAGKVLYLCQLDDEDIFVTEDGEVVGFVNDPTLIDYFLPAGDGPMTPERCLTGFYRSRAAHRDHPRP